MTVILCLKLPVDAGMAGFSCFVSKPVVNELETWLRRS